MASNLKAIARLAGDDEFRRRVKAAIYVAAVAVGSESNDLESEYHDRRRALVPNLMGTFEDDYVALFSWMAAANPVLTSSSDDDDIQFTVNGLWSAVASAGAGPTP